MKGRKDRRSFSVLNLAVPDRVHTVLSYDTPPVSMYVYYESNKVLSIEK